MPAKAERESSNRGGGSSSKQVSSDNRADTHTMVMGAHRQERRRGRDMCCRRCSSSSSSKHTFGCVSCLRVRRGDRCRSCRWPLGLSRDERRGFLSPATLSPTPSEYFNIARALSIMMASFHTLLENQLPIKLNGERAGQGPIIKQLTWCSVHSTRLYAHRT